MDPAGVQPQIPSCFQIHEIVTIIAEILLATGRDLIRYHADGTAGPVEFDQPDYASVAFFARTCQATVGPGLRVLWSHQEGLEHLIKTLPRDARAFKFVGLGREIASPSAFVQSLSLILMLLYSLVLDAVYILF